NGFNGVDEATFSNGSVALTDLSFTNRNFTFPQIDNNGDVIAQDQYLVSPNLYTYIRLWKPSGAETGLETGNSANGDLYLIPTISPNGTQFAYQDSLSGTIVLYIGIIAYVNGTPVVTGTTPVNTFPAGSGGLRPMIANNGAVVVRDGSTTTSPIMLYQVGHTPVTIARSADFSALGNNPGIDATGNIVAFYGDLTSAGAADLNSTNQNNITQSTLQVQVDQLTAGPSIFVSIP